MTNEKGNVEPAIVEVDFAAKEGDLSRIWTSIGFDEINWAYTPQGKDLLNTLSTDIAEQPYYVRNHNAFTSGNGLSYPAGGSTNIYREDADGNPVYNWEIIDQVYDAYVANGFHCLIELGFLPFDLVPKELRNYTGFRSGDVNLDLGKEDYENGKWKLPPKDYSKWQGLVEAFVSHLVERYGEDEVSKWYFELWNEPDIKHYWLGTVEEYCKLYDYSVAGATKAFSRVKIGGPGSTDHGNDFLRHFLNHCINEKNEVTGEVGTQIDFMSFHTKGAGYSPRRTYGHPVPKDSPSLSKVIGDIQRSLGVIGEFPELRGKPVFVDECDPAVGTIYGVYDNPNFVVCNTEYYPSFVASMVAQILKVNKTVPVPVTMITHWAFYFEGKRFFEGNRTLTTNHNIHNPIMAGLKMLGKLGKEQVSLQSSAAAFSLDAGYTNQVQLVDGLATGGDTSSVMLWNHCDDWTVVGSRQIDLKLANLPYTAGQSVEVKHWRIDADHSNAYTEWVKMGRPEGPSVEQLNQLKAKQQLTLLEEPGQRTLEQDGTLQLSFDLPVHGLSLIEITGSK